MIAIEDLRREIQQRIGSPEQNSKVFSYVAAKSLWGIIARANCRGGKQNVTSGWSLRRVPEEFESEPRK